MEQWIQIRQRVLREGVSKRQILRGTGMHWTTLEKIFQHPIPPGYCRTKPRASKIDPFRGRIQQMLTDGKHGHRRQYYTAKKIWQILQQEGFTGGYTIVKETVRQIKRTSKEVFMPPKHPPGEAQVDFGHALVKMAGILRKICFFVMALPYSDVFFLLRPMTGTEIFGMAMFRHFAFLVGCIDGSVMTTARSLSQKSSVHVSEN
jgi:transposase